MGKRALAAKVAFLDVFLGIVPSSASVGHEDGQREACTETTDKQSQHAGYAKQQASGNGDDDGEHGGNNHLVLSGTCGNLYATAIVGRACALKDTGNLLKLSAHLDDHLLGSATHGFHRQTAEQEGGHCTDESAYEDAWIHQVHLEIVHEGGDVLDLSEHGLHGRVTFGGHACYGFLDFFNVGSEQGQRRQCSRTNGESLTRSGGRVAQCIEGVGAVAHFLAQFAHLGVTTGIVGNGAVGIGGQRDA